jgi:hypothetical protein
MRKLRRFKVNRFFKSFGSTVGAGAIFIVLALFVGFVLADKLGGDNLSKDDLNKILEQRLGTPTAMSTATAATATSQTTTQPSATVSPAISSSSLLKGVAPSYGSNGTVRDPRRVPGGEVACQSGFEPGTNWVLCEPGEILDNTATFTRAEVDAVYHTNCPEGGFWYGSLGKADIKAGGVLLSIPAQDHTNNLVVIRCPLSDGKVDTDLNLTLDVGNFVTGHVIWSPIMPHSPYGAAYVSRDWFAEQLAVSSKLTDNNIGGSNCGSAGCSITRVWTYDVNSQFLQVWEVSVDNIKVNGERGKDIKVTDWKLNDKLSNSKTTAGQ